jgi:hypothetical protein
LSDKENGKHI